MLKFGGVFIFDEEEYVYLASSNSRIYAAKILKIEETKRIQNAYNQTEKNPKKRYLINQDILYCYVILDTKEYKNRAAHCGTAGRHTDLKIESLGRVIVCERDLKEIKKEIMEGPVNSELKDLVKDIEI